MSPSRSKDLVAALALAAAVGLGAYLLARERGWLGTRWTDGARSFGAETGPLVRHAVWDAPEALSELGDARDPALSPDGRWLVFASGERGLNVELYLAEMVDGRPEAVRPLAALCSPADELAPAFGLDGLYFASDRPGGAGGLDLWRAPFAAGLFGAPEPLGPGLNTAANETDPAPFPDGTGLAFAADRARPDLDLYLAAPDEAGFWQVTPLEGLNTPAEERGPAFASEGRSLYFASDRAGGSFELYRALLGRSGFAAPGRVGELDDPAQAELAPEPSADGFALLFARETPGGASTLLRARSLELFRVPPPAITLAQWLTLAALVLLGLLALLAKRWRALDVLYKCLLVSLLLHLLLLYGLRRVFPDETRYETGREQGPSFRVRLAPGTPAEPAAGLSGLSGPRAPARAELAAEVARLAAAPARFAPSAPELPDAPAGRAGPERSAEPSPAPDLAAPREVRARPAAAAPGLALEAAAPAAREAVPAAAPLRQASTPEVHAPLAPVAARTTAPEAAAPSLAAGPAPSELAPAPRDPSTPELAGPRESLARAAGPAPALALAPASAGPERTPSLARPERREGAPAPLVALAPVPAAPAAALGAATEPARAPERGALDARNTPAAPQAALRAPAETAPDAASSAPTFDATQGLTAARTAPPEPSHAAPERTRAGVSAPPSLAPAPLAAPARSSEIPAAPTRGAPELARALAASPTAAELRRPEPPEGEPAEVAPSARFDATADLSPRASTASPRSPSAPARPSLTGAAPLPVAPAPLALSAPPPPAPLDRPGAAPRLAETPYQNRFGAQKLRALEEHGGSAETERAVAAGLAYLARIQERNGAWGQRSDAHSKYLDVRIGKTGLALLAFLGAGHVPEGDTEHAGVAARAVAHLLAAQDAGSGHFGSSCSYGHGIATYALAECFALTGDERLRAPLERALEQILRHQSRVEDPRFLGGWGYYFADGRVWNGDEWPRVSIVAWQVMALESARLGGLSVPDEAFDAAQTFLVNAWDPRARAFRYAHDPERLSSGYPILPASTPAALFALSLLGVDPAGEELAAARRFVLTRAPDGYRYTGDDDFVRLARGNPYFWYYATLALFRVGGSEWERWNLALQETLLPAQEPDGSWRPLDVYAEYAGDEDEERTYATAMSVLSLEIYYRYFTPLLRVR